MKISKNVFEKKTWIIIGVAAVLLVVLGVGGFVISRGGTQQEENLLELGQRYLDEMNYEQAIVCFEEYLEIEPKSVEAYIGLAEAYLAIGDVEKALEVLAEGYVATGSENLQNLRNQYEERYVGASGSGGGDVDDESVTEDEVLYEEYDFETHVTPDGLDVDAEYLTVRVQGNRSAMITISGIVVQPNYLTNLSTSEKNDAEYFWRVEIYGDQDAYSVSTASWAFDPGAKETKGIEAMQHSVWVYDGDSWPLIGDAEMSYTSESITWAFNIPEEYPFDFTKVDCYEVKVIDISQSLNLRRKYLLTE